MKWCFITYVLFIWLWRAVITYFVICCCRWYLDWRSLPLHCSPHQVLWSKHGQSKYTNLSFPYPPPFLSSLTHLHFACFTLSLIFLHILHQIPSVYLPVCISLSVFLDVYWCLSLYMCHKLIYLCFGNLHCYFLPIFFFFFFLWYRYLII